MTAKQEVNKKAAKAAKAAKGAKAAEAKEKAKEKEKGAAGGTPGAGAGDAPRSEDRCAAAAGGDRRHSRETREGSAKARPAPALSGEEAAEAGHPEAPDRVGWKPHHWGQMCFVPEAPQATPGAHFRSL